MAHDRHAPAPLPAALVWFRRDLRAHDHAALYHALRSARRVWCAFVFDRDILDPLLARGLVADRRVEFIRDSLAALDEALAALGREHGREGVRLLVRHGHAIAEIDRLARELHVQAVYANHDDEPAALARDAQVRGLLARHGIALHTSKDHLVFERDELLTGAGAPYGAFAPYRNAWLRRLDAYFLKAYPVQRHAAALAPLPDGMAAGLPALEAMGFARSNLHELKIAPGWRGAQALLADFLPRMADYARTRDFPAVKGPSYLSVHLRFGTCSVRELAREAHARAQAGSEGARAWLSELARRDFQHQVLHHHPRVVGHCFKPEFDHLRWEHGKHADALFAAWCEGRTGYPLVDAAMRQLAQTGYMHHRLRMLTAGFLCKGLGIDWRRGEQHFAEHLNDFDLAANNAGWQAAASTGCDAPPWARSVDPVAHSRRLDPQGRFIRRYLPRLARLPDELIHAPWEARPVDLAAAGVELGDGYPAPLLRPDEARERMLARYGAVKEA
ncbi:cryptochrome/photolyase family protein [Piscinibacter sp.]|uniref:cryptochrome/photolyase family protein n=1 Tax=Piscinibacter sp. TaxID=1903157 RepID=UPI0039E30B77